MDIRQRSTKGEYTAEVKYRKKLNPRIEKAKLPRPNPIAQQQKQAQKEKNLNINVFFYTLYKMICYNCDAKEKPLSKSTYFMPAYVSFERTRNFVLAFFFALFSLIFLVVGGMSGIVRIGVLLEWYTIYNICTASKKLNRFFVLRFSPAKANGRKKNHSLLFSYFSHRRLFETCLPIFFFNICSARFD